MLKKHYHFGSWNKTQNHPNLLAENRISILYTDVLSGQRIIDSCDQIAYPAWLQLAFGSYSWHLWLLEGSVEEWNSKFLAQRMTEYLFSLDHQCQEQTSSALLLHWKKGTSTVGGILTQSNWRILVPISNHSPSSWPNSCSCFKYVKLWNIFICFMFQPPSALSSSVCFSVRNLQAFCLWTNDPEYLRK